MPCQVFRSAMYNNIGTELYRGLKGRGGEGIIHYNQCFCTLNSLADFLNISNLQSRIGRAFQPYKPCFAGKGINNCLRISGIDILYADTELCIDMRENPEGATIDIINRN